MPGNQIEVLDSKDFFGCARKSRTAFYPQAPCLTFIPLLKSGFGRRVLPG
jgi:hypothetical protein